MKFINSLSILLFIFILSGCTDDLILKDHNGEFEEGPLVEAYLSLSVDNYTISSAGTRAAEPSETPEIASDAEKRIDNIWVFQYEAATGQQLIRPAYYEITNQETLKILKVLLKDGIESNICIVTNTKDSNWTKGKDLSTIDKLKAMTLSNPDPILLADLNNPILSSRRSIPMEGTSGNVVVSSGSTIEVGVQRMYAKIKISFDNLIDGMSPKSIEVSSIPRYCKIESLGINLAEEDKAIYNEDDNYWVVRTFNSGNKDSEYVIYVPENLQGETDNINEGLKGEDAPVRALAIDLTMKYQASGEEGSSELSYCVYPGGNDTNNFNIRRNSVYRVKIKINSASEEAHTPSSNCFVVIPGETLTFEPYNRKEIGGGYKIEDYLNPEVEELRIDKVGIVWQTMQAIGDNSAGNLVKYNEESKKISVKTNKEGNALVAAYNSAGDIIWSWHIWITGNDPGNIGNAVVYTTYAWDSKGIKFDQPRIEGYAVMPCNLGALANAPEDMGNADTPESWYCQNLRTYGTIYQWGRKDPFPPIKFYNKNNDSYKNGGYNGYNAHQANIEVYDNNHKRIPMTTDGTPTPTKDELFNAISTTDIGSTKQAGLKYAINNPAMFITASEAFSGNNYNSASKYVNRGDWLPEGDPCLWGGYPTEGKEKYSPYPDRAIWRNYGTKKEDKTIFDPCPKGWRVPPGDLWLGFTNEGINFGAYSQLHLDKRINCPTNYTVEYFQKNNGFWLCLDGWKTEDPSKHSFFPSQGSRLCSGQCYLAGVCGNYHNATVDAQVTIDNVLIDRVNILHIHTDVSAKINTFEDQLIYYNKAVAGPIRCVRDRKN